MRIVMNLVYSVADGARRLERNGHMIATFDTKAEALCAAQMRGERLAEMGSEPRLAQQTASLRGQGLSRASKFQASFAFGRLPQLDLVAFRVEDPAELAVFGVVGLFQNVAALAT